MYADILRKLSTGINLVQHVVSLQQFGWITSHVALIQHAKKLLDLHLHPIAVHFPIAATAASFIVPVIALLIPSIANILFPAITLVAMILPLLVIIGGISGYIGSILRYKTRKV